MTYTEIDGDLIKLAKEEMFDVIAHGCNCFCRQKRGLAPQMVAAFGTDRYLLEGESFEGDINKLGQIEGKNFWGSTGKKLVVLNAYTQYQWSTETKPLDYEALTLCFKKINHKYKSLHIGLPQIGCHLAGGDWTVVKQMIQTFLKDCTVTVVIFKP